MNLEAVDVVRIIAAALGFTCMFLMGMRARRARIRKGDRFTGWATSALLVAMAFIVVQEMEQIGHPFVWWRLPLLMLVELLTLGALWRSDV